MTQAITRTVTLSYARTHLHQLVREVEQGAVIGITQRGKLVAWLTPVEEGTRTVPEGAAQTTAPS